MSRSRASNPSHASTFPRYDIGTPTLTDIYLSPSGNDANTGQSAQSPLRTLGAAWQQLSNLSTTGYRLNLAAGTYPFDGARQNDYSDRIGSARFPIVVRPTGGRGTATLQGGLNLRNVAYLYLLDVTIEAGGAAQQFDNNVVHIERGDHVLFRGVTIRGLTPGAFQEVLKVNQSEHVYIEESDLTGAYQSVVDYVSVQHGHIFQSKIHGAGEWCAYFKGGSAYHVVEANDFTACGVGAFQAGEGTNFEIMRSPWIHYEAYDIKFVNNVVHDILGHGISVAGGYNILIAHNTFYRVGTSPVGYHLFQVVHGIRSCRDTSENGVGNADVLCGAFLAAGGWGMTESGSGGQEGEWIPSRNVFVMNNIFFNPAPAQTTYRHAYARAPQTPPASSNVASPARVDTNLSIRGNTIWNGDSAHEIGIGDPGDGCQTSNPTCNAAQFLANNSVNVAAPALVDPPRGDYRPVPGGNVALARSVAIPNFSWTDAPSRPTVPTGSLDNAVTRTFSGAARAANPRPGAFE
jgi:hypothetical protein